MKNSRSSLVILSSEVVSLENQDRAIQQEQGHLLRFFPSAVCPLRVYVGEIDAPAVLQAANLVSRCCQNLGSAF